MFLTPSFIQTDNTDGKQQNVLLKPLFFNTHKKIIYNLVNWQTSIILLTGKWLITLDVFKQMFMSITAFYVMSLQINYHYCTELLLYLKWLQIYWNYLMAHFQTAPHSWDFWVLSAFYSIFVSSNVFRISDLISYSEMAPTLPPPATAEIFVVGKPLK